MYVSPHICTQHYVRIKAKFIICNSNLHDIIETINFHWAPEHV